MAADRVTLVSPDIATVERIAGVLRAAGFDVEPEVRGSTGPGPRDHSEADWVLLDRRPGTLPGRAPVPIPHAGGPPPGFTPLPLEEVERRHLAATLEHTGGNKRQAALLLGIARSTLQQKVRRYGLDRGSEA